MWEEQRSWKAGKQLLSEGGSECQPECRKGRCWPIWESWGRKVGKSRQSVFERVKCNCLRLIGWSVWLGTQQRAGVEV